MFRFIKLPRWSRSELIILHEIGHVVTPSDYAGHGPEYAGNYLMLVAHFMGQQVAAELTAAFDSQNVKYKYNGSYSKKNDDPKC